MDDSEADLTKLVHQIARRVPSLELDSDVVKVQVTAFKATEAAILKSLSHGSGKQETREEADDSSIAKLVEEMKALPTRVAERLSETGDPFRRRRMRRLHPMMIEELMHMSGDPGDPVGILMAASIVRDDAPWLYELAMEVYRAAKSGDSDAIEREMTRLHRFAEFGVGGPLMEEFGFAGKESHIFIMEFPRMLEHVLRRTLESKKPEKARTLPERKRTPPTAEP
jgi:hypothetical protein